MTSSMLRRQLKNLVQNYSEAEVKVREATSNDPWGPSSSQMADISDLTYNVVACNEIMTMLWKRLKDDKNWRHIHKSLTLLEYLLKTGDDRVLLKMKDNVYIVKALTEYRFVEKDGKDQGVNVREKAKVVLVLMEDDEKLKEERDFAVKTREKTSKSSAASSSDTVKDPNYKPCYVPGAMGLPSLDNIPSVADLTASFAARKEERLRQEAERKEEERRGKMSEDELKWEDAGKGNNVGDVAWGGEKAEEEQEEEVKPDPWGAPKEPKEATDPWGTPTRPDTTDTAASSDPWGAPTKAAPKTDEDPFAAPKTGEDPFTAPKNGEDPFAAPKTGEDPFAAPKTGEDPFAAPKTGEDPFAAPKTGEDPFAAPKTGEDPFAAPKDGPDPFSSASDDPFNTSKSSSDPFNAPKDKEDPFGAPKGEADPFSSSNNDPFNAQKDDPFNTPKDDPFSTPKDDPFKAPASAPPKEDPFAAPASSTEDPFAAPTTPPKEDPFSATAAPAQGDPFAAPTTPPGEDPFSAPSKSTTEDPFAAPTTPPKEDPFACPAARSPEGGADAWGASASSPPAAGSDPWGAPSAPKGTKGGDPCGDPWGDGASAASPIDNSDPFGDTSKPDNDPWGAPGPAPASTDDSDPFGDGASKTNDPWGAPCAPTGKRTAQEEVHRRAASFLGWAGASLVDLDDLFSSNPDPVGRPLVGGLAVGTFQSRGVSRGPALTSGASLPQLGPFGPAPAPPRGAPPHTFGAARPTGEPPLFAAGAPYSGFSATTPPSGGAGPAWKPLVDPLPSWTGAGQQPGFFGGGGLGSGGGAARVGGGAPLQTQQVSGSGSVGSAFRSNNPFLF